MKKGVIYAQIPVNDRCTIIHCSSNIIVEQGDRLQVWDDCGVLIKDITDLGWSDNRTASVYKEKLYILTKTMIKQVDMKTWEVIATINVNTKGTIGLSCNRYYIYHATCIGDTIIVNKYNKKLIKTQTYSETNELYKKYNSIMEFWKNKLYIITYFDGRGNEEIGYWLPEENKYISECTGCGDLFSGYPQVVESSGTDYDLTAPTIKIQDGSEVAQVIKRRGNSCFVSDGKYFFDGYKKDNILYVLRFKL